MKFQIKCACGDINQYIEITDRHICNCSMCKRYVGGKTCTFFSSNLKDFDISKTISYSSGDTSKRIFCTRCFTFIGMLYTDHESIYVNSTTLDERPIAPRTYRHIWKNTQCA